MPEVIDNVKVGNFIKKLLKDNKMIQDDLAKALNISKSAVSQNLNGKSSFDILNLLAISKLFDISLDDLLNMKATKEENYVSEYEKVARKGISELHKTNPVDLNIDKPDFYGKVFVDYVIELNQKDLLVYLISLSKSFVEPYYHRSKEIYLKLILYMLHNNIEGVFTYIVKYATLFGSFEVTHPSFAVEIWQHLNREENDLLIVQMMNKKIPLQVKAIGLIPLKKDVRLIDKDGWLNIISMYKLDHILKLYFNYFAKRSDIFKYTIVMSSAKYYIGIVEFLKFFIVEPFSLNEKNQYRVQQAILFVLDLEDHNLFYQFYEYELYTNLTAIIIEAMKVNRKDVIDFILIQAEEVKHIPLDYRLIGQEAVLLNRIQEIERVVVLLSQDDLNYLLSIVTPENTDLILYLVDKGGKIDFKYYNNQSLERMNNLISYLMSKKGERK